MANYAGDANDNGYVGSDSDEIISGGAGVDTLHGGGGYDTIVGGDDPDILKGENDNDQLYGDAGADTLFGGSGYDSLFGGTGADQMWGGKESDVYYVDNAGDLVLEFANEGVDLVLSTVSYTLSANVENLGVSAAGGATGVGNSLNNQIWGGTGNDLLKGEGGDDLLNGNGGKNHLQGGVGNDILVGDGDDTLNGGTGDDVYQLQKPDYGLPTIVEGVGGGVDRIEVAASEFDLRSTPYVENLTLLHDFVKTLLPGQPMPIGGLDVIEKAYGNALNNVMKGFTGKEVLSGLEGNDVLFGNGGDDSLLGGEGNDSLIGGDGHDRLDGAAGVDSFDGGLGDDTYGAEQGEAIVDAGGFDTVVTTSATFDLSAYASIEALVFSGPGDRTGLGSTRDDRIVGGEGHDSLSGLDGADFLNGLGGNDTLDGGAGNDIFSSNHVLDNPAPGGGQIVMPAGDDTWLGGDGDDVGYVFDGAGKLTFLGGAGADKLVVTSVSAETRIVANGGAGEDSLEGGVSGDTLIGGGGLDQLKGGGGGDRLIGGARADQLWGGDGADRFVFTAVSDSAKGAGLGVDVVGDWANGDLLDFSAIDANAALSGEQAFQFIGTAGFTAAGQVRAVYNKANDVTVVMAEVDGDGLADMFVNLSGEHVLTSSDFVL